MLAKRIERFQVLGLASLRSASPRVRFQVYIKKTSGLAPMETASFYTYRKVYKRYREQRDNGCSKKKMRASNTTFPSNAC
jgi:hypothetical protein